MLAAACTGSGAPATTTAGSPTTGGTTSIPAAATTTSGDAGTTSPAPTTTTTSEPPGTTTAPPDVTARIGEGVDPAVADALAAVIAELARATEEVRGLEFLAPPDVAVVSEAELADLIREDVAEELEDIDIDERLFRLLGLYDDERDLRSLIVELLAEQVLGFYDGDTGEMVVAGEAAELSPLTEITVIHELIHALTDQHFGFHASFREMLDAERYDEASALQALVEGDATYFQLVYMQESLDLAELVALQREISEQDFSVLESSPRFLQADLEFPYDQGFRFVSELVAEGGIAAVDKAYVESPTTTEHILHPERFLGAEARLDVALPPTPLAGYEVYEESVFGEWGTRLLFLETEDGGMIAQLGDGWGGDRYRVLDNGTDVVLLLRYVGDREEDALDVAQAWLRLFEARFGEGVESGAGQLHESERGYGYLDRSGDTILVVVAGDPAAGAAVRQAVEG